MESNQFNYKIAELYVTGDGEFAAMDAENKFEIKELFELAMKNDDLFEYESKEDDECVDFTANITWYEMSCEQDAKNMKEMHDALDQRQDYDRTKGSNSYCFLCTFQGDKLVKYEL